MKTRFKKIFTKKNFLRSLINAVVFIIGIFLVDLLFYYFGWRVEKIVSINSLLLYFILIFSVILFLDGRDYTWRDVVKFKNLNKK